MWSMDSLGFPEYKSETNKSNTMNKNKLLIIVKPDFSTDLNNTKE